MAIYPVILAGGSGSRLWPLSRQNHPKQFLDLLGHGQTLLQSTIERAKACSSVLPLIIANKEHRFLLQHQIEPLGLSYKNTLLEPCAKNTTAAVALGCLQILDIDPDAHILFLPADHYLPDTQAFVQRVHECADHLPEMNIGLLGVKPSYAATQYGYIRFAAQSQMAQVTGFIEKPNEALAQSLLAKTGLAWNSGMLLGRAQAFYDALLEFEPELLRQVELAFNDSQQLYDFKLVGDQYQDIKSCAFDVSVLEKSRLLNVSLLEQDWDDLGSWSSLLARRKALGLSDFNVFSDGPIILAFGAQDVVLVQNDDVIFVANQDELADMNAISDYLQTHGLQHLLNRIDVHRPWGQFKVLAQDEHFVVKRLMVYPGAQISLQSHQYRKENWVVVKGCAEVQIDEQTRTLTVGESICIEQNQKHRLRNPDHAVLEIIEVQSGERLDEDDIIRYDDQYERHLNT